MFCNKCGNEIPDDSKYCSKCGNQIETEETAKDKEVEKGQAVAIQVNKENTVQKSVCLVCKGRGKKIKKRYAAISIIITIFVLIPMLFIFGTMEGSTGLLGFILLASSVLGWGFKKRKCPVCDGKGSINL